MALETARPEPSLDSPIRPPRRSLWWPAVFVLLVFAGGVVAGRTVFDGGPRPVPIEKGHSWWVDPEHSKPVEAYGQPDPHVFRYAHGEQTGYGLTLLNRGDMPVTITKLPLFESDASMLQDLEVRIGPDGLGVGADNGSLVPFEPFTLAPGQERYVGIFGSFGGCAYNDEGGAQILEAIPVRYREAFGRERQANVETGLRLVFVGPAAKDCPEG